MAIFVSSAPAGSRRCRCARVRHRPHLRLAPLPLGHDPGGGTRFGSRRARSAELGELGVAASRVPGQSSRYSHLTLRRSATSAGRYRDQVEAVDVPGQAGRADQGFAGEVPRQHLRMQRHRPARSWRPIRPASCSPGGDFAGGCLERARCGGSASAAATAWEILPLNPDEVNSSCKAGRKVSSTESVTLRSLMAAAAYPSNGQCGFCLVAPARARVPWNSGDASRRAPGYR